ncbi:FAD/NAD(P)-binding oxidoreductase family protein [Abeliophyllum distichum]|uniref:FAD/NAD(P)-binding oxidoreductase family protein n=1 Tax=Abeliophyllum distichum TaxID=126358 RepID=A0ABD1NRL7_9LAMI
MSIISHNFKASSLHLSFSNSNPKLSLPNFTQSLNFPNLLQVKCAKRTKRTGKLRYPSEKKKQKLQQHNETDVKNKFEGVWRLFKLGISAHEDPGKDFWGVSEPLLQEIAKVLEFPVASMLPPEAFKVVRKSFDARKLQKEPKFVYTVDMDVDRLLILEPRTWEFISELEPKVGVIERVPHGRSAGDLISIIRNYPKRNETAASTDVFGRTESYKFPNTRKPKVAVVGSGPSGLFASLVLAEFGADVTLIERGQAVEQRGRDIGALVVRRMLQLESNFCFGEGGAGTWSDGKLVTRIGKNNGSVMAVLETLVHFGAPSSILVDGKPHLGTDRLIPLLRNFRKHLQELGVTIRFGTRVDDLIVDVERVVGVKVSDSSCSSESSSQKLGYDAVILAVGHSARDTYQMLLSHNVDVVQKDFAVGLRIEHPQELINSIQYSGLAHEVQSGRGKIPVADYKVAEYVNQKDMVTPLNSGPIDRSCYSFCMCPGGQVVLTSTNPSELCINGMSFSRRSSRWANAAIVVTVSSKDFEALNFHGPLAGLEFQRAFERRAATMGGGNFIVPVQTVTDFLDGKISETNLPTSSYRLGVKAANLHDLFPAHLTAALQHSILLFDNELPGFVSKSALLHGVETRTSSPVQITRRSDTWESTSLKGLYPIGEGAGYAGGITSAAVDGMYAGFALAQNLGLYNGSMDSILGKAQTAGFFKY